MSEVRAVGANSISSGSLRASKALKAGRVCKQQGCATVLSIYNKGRYCYQHEPMATPRTRGKKIA
jgi:hypothetical protein